MDATITRTLPGPPDTWGNPTTLPPEVLPDTIPCYVFTKSRVDVNNVALHAIVEELRMLTTPDADVREGDLLLVHDGRTNELLYSRVRTLTRQLKSGNSRVAHASFLLESNR